MNMYADQSPAGPNVVADHVYLSHVEQHLIHHRQWGDRDAAGRVAGNNARVGGSLPDPVALPTAQI